MKSHQGFTLIELVIVIILLAILAVSILPKLDGTSSYEPYTFRAQLISALRLTQQRAMQQTDNTLCHHIVLDNVKTRYGIPDRVDCAITTFPTNWTADSTGIEVDERYNVTFDIDGKANPKLVSFDNMGRPLDDCGGGCEINITQTDSNEKISIKIESEGYIHAI